MTVSDEGLAQARNVSIRQVRLLRASRGTTNETLEALSDAGFRRALHRLAYPDRRGIRTEFRYRQAVGDGGERPPRWGAETGVTELYVAGVAVTAGRTAGVPTSSAGAAPAQAGLSLASWQWLGPGNIGGRIRGI